MSGFSLTLLNTFKVLLKRLYLERVHTNVNTCIKKCLKKEYIFGIFEFYNSVVTACCNACFRFNQGTDGFII